jgi:anti-sigma regulatory factor (Ser/Thr protein kinase)
MESIKETTVISVTEQTHLAAARRAGADLCRRMHLTEATIARAELIAVELASNILHHAVSGHMMFAPVPGSPCSMQIVASDRGPGVGNVMRAMQDGFSTGGTPGLGLGAVGRQADGLDLYSQPGAGTMVAATLHDRTLPEPTTAVLSTHIQGETLNGDCWGVYALEDRTIFLVIDGLGHGHYASQAASIAIEVADHAFRTQPEITLSTLLQRMHGPMQATRGAAVLVVSVSETQALCCGIGNISAALCTPDGTTRNLVSHNGTVGHRMARVQEFSYPLTPGTFLVMHSDGVSARWKLSQYPGLLQHSPAIVAGVLYRDGARERDDATILVSRLGDLGRGAGRGNGERTDA